MLHIIDLILFVFFAIFVLYIFFFSIASLKRRGVSVPSSKDPRRIAILIPAYKEDRVILGCVESCLSQDYPSGYFEIIVIADEMQPATLEALEKLPVCIVQVKLEKRTKAKALNEALKRFDHFDVALVLDADNIIESLFLQKINGAFLNGYEVVQTHRVAKNMNTDFAILDAASEEINNSIFRKGHVNLGLSSALIGSGMAFEYKRFKAVMAEIKAIGGFDKELELTYFKDGKKIAYLEQAIVWDEKVQKPADYSNQRRRWISAQFHYLILFWPYLSSAIKSKNIDFCDKLFQMALLPRVMLLGVMFCLSVLCSFVDLEMSIKWWVGFGLLILSLLIAIPRSFYNLTLVKALCALPHVFILTLFTMLKLKGANKTFIHTQHG